ncbi:hypothetical protein RhiJN_25976 [Ceratobasidium sp. AG-Ba]|nr:hypothetical protein RhiJN_25976 [Ceratobasidium sp. AG-Ba]
MNAGASRDHELLLNVKPKDVNNLLSMAKLTWCLEQVSDKSIQKVLGGFWRKEQAMRKEINGKAKELADMANKLASKDRKIAELNTVRQELEKTKAELAFMSDRLAAAQRKLNQAREDTPARLPGPPPLLPPRPNNAADQPKRPRDVTTNMHRKVQVVENAAASQEAKRKINCTPLANGRMQLRYLSNRSTSMTWLQVTP